VERLPKVLDKALQERIAGDCSIADIAIGPWLRPLRNYYKAAALAGWDHLKHVPAYLDRFPARPAVERGLLQPSR